MRAFEWLACGYFTLLGVVSLSRSLRLGGTGEGPGRPFAAFLAAAALVALIVAVATAGQSPLRDWIPHLYLVAGYWLPAWLVGPQRSATGFERWLCRSDDLLRPRLVPVPRVLLPCVELAYLACYPLVPISFALVWTLGTPSDVNRFWFAVLAAGYVCYGSLPWFVSRPPRHAVTGEGASAVVRTSADGVGSLNAAVLGRVSHELNTFPSGHVAVAGATAAMLAAVSPAAGLAVVIVAAAIAVGACTGRYHYVIDVVLGVAAAGAGVALAMIAG